MPLFVAGFIIGLIVVAVVRFFQGMLGLSDIPDLLLFNMFNDGAAWWDDEAMVMFAMLFGAAGFIIGAGGLRDTPLDPNPPQQGLMLAEPDRRLRIPADPDAPRAVNEPVRQLVHVLPSTGVIVGVIVGAVLLTLLITLVLPTVEQVSSDTASAAEFGEGDFNLLGLLKFDDVNQGTLFIGFTVIVLLLVLGAPVGMALLFYLLNREVEDAKSAPADPQPVERLLPFRVVGFFTQWLLDLVRYPMTLIRPR